MGSVLQWAYFIWFFLDCFIVYSTFKYGWKQDVVPSEKKDHIFVTALCILLWGAILYFFIPQYDDHIGAYTGWIVNVNMSMAFVLQKVKQPEFGTNRWVAVLKFLWHRSLHNRGVYQSLSNTNIGSTVFYIYCS
jgi:hypothetical protein